MNGPTIFAALRDALAELYREQDTARVIINDAGLAAAKISFSTRAQTNWHNILTAAIQQNCLDALLDIARNEYLDNQALYLAYIDYRHWIEQGEKLIALSQLLEVGDKSSVVATSGGMHIEGSITTDSGDVVGRDQNIHEGGTISVGDISNSIGVAIGHGATATVTIIESPKPRIPLERPARAEHFQDRKEELAQLLTELQPGKVVTLCGPGGMGKTALAAEAIWHLADSNQPPARFPDGIIFHTFYGQSQVALALENIARFFGEELRPTPKEAAKRALSGRQVLLLLDGAEEADDLHQILDIRNLCGVLITSRSRKDALTIRRDLEPLSPDDAVTLLQAWGGQWADNREAVQRISRLVGHLPLALRLAGRYLSYSDENASKYLTWLEETPLAALDQGKRQLESVPLLLARSLAQVSESARKVLSVVGLLALAPFTRETVTATLSLSAVEAQQLLGELISYGLLLRSVDTYEVSHALIHTYARLQLTPSKEDVTRLAAYYTAFANRYRENFDQLNSVRSHILALLHSCSKYEAWDAVSSLVKAIDNYLNLQGYWTDRLKAIEFSVTAARATLNRQDECTALNNLGRACISLGRIEQAIDYYQQANSLATDIGNRKSVGATLGNLGMAYYFLGQVENALKYYEQALSIAQELGDRKGEAADLGNLGLTYINLGQMEKAIGYFQQVLSIAQELGNREYEGSTLGNLGIAYQYLGKIEQSVEYFQQALVVAKEIGDRRGEGNHLGCLGVAYRYLGKHEEAISYHQQALLIAQEIGDRRNEGNWLGNLGLEHSDRKQYTQAIEYCKQALAITREIGDRYGEGYHLGNLGLAFAGLEQMEQAIDYYQQALIITRETGDRNGEGTHLRSIGSAYVALGQAGQAIDYYQQAISIVRETGHRHDEAACLSDLGSVYRDLGEYTLARQVWEQALHIFEEIKLPYADTVREFLSSLSNE